MSTLGSMLVQDQIVGVTEIEQALQYQVIHGGDLATNLLELQLVEEDVLAAYAARSAGIPVLLKELLDVSNQRAIKLLPWLEAKRHRILPIRLEDDRMIVAVSAPLVGEDIEELAFRLNVSFEPYFVFDFRLAMGLNRHYGLPLPPREMAIQKKLASDFVVDQPPTVHPPEDGVGIFGAFKDRAAPPLEAESVARGRIVSINKKTGDDVLDVESSRKPREGEDGTIRMYLPDESLQEKPQLKAPRQRPAVGAPRKQKSGDSDEGAAYVGKRPPGAEPITLGARPDWAHSIIPSSAPPREVVSAPVSLSESRVRLDNAHSRDEILEVVIDFARQAFDFMLLFVVHGQVAQGKTAVWGARIDRQVEHLAIPLDQKGMFQAAFENRSFYLGAPGKTLNDDIALKTMSRSTPVNCAIVPIALRHRVILMIYGDSAEHTVRPDQVSGLVRFSRYVSEAFERLLLKQKYGHYDNVPRSSVPVKPKISAVEKEVGSSAPKRPSMTDWAGRYHVHTDEKNGRVSASMIDDLGAGARRSRPASRVPGRRASKLPRHSEPQIQNTEHRPHDLSDDKSAPKPKMEPPQLFEMDRRPPVSIESSVVRDASRIIRTQKASELDRANDDLRNAAAEYTATEGDDFNLQGGGAGGTDPAASAPSTSAGKGHLSGDEQGPPKMVSEPAVGLGPLSVIPKRESQRSVIVEMSEEVDRLVERVLSTKVYDQSAVELLCGIGDDALKKLTEFFPGPLTFDRYGESGKLPRVVAHGPLLRAMTSFGKPAIYYLMPLLESVDTDVRFYATFMFSELLYPEALGALTTRIFDNDRQIRALVIDVLRGFVKYPEYRWAVRDVSEVLVSSRSSVEAKRIAADALGELREPSGVEGLCQMLETVDKALVERCHRALVKITFCDFGFSGARWQNWYRQHERQHRTEWAMEGLGHSKEEIRTAAIAELKRAVGDAIEWPRLPYDSKVRQEIKRRCRDWWKSEGWALHSNLGGR